MRFITLYIHIYGLNSKFYVKFIKGINKLLPMNIIQRAVHKIKGGAFTGIIAMWARWSVR
jgi:hypothetical protein